MSDDFITRDEVEQLIKEAIKDCGYNATSIAENLVGDFKKDYDYDWKQLDDRIDELEHITEDVDFTRIIQEYSAVEAKLNSFEKEIKSLLETIKQKDEMINKLNSKIKTLLNDKELNIDI